MDPPLTEIKTPRKDNDMEFKYPAIPPVKVGNIWPFFLLGILTYYLS